MSTIIPFINAMGESVTFRDRQLGGRDAETRWPDVTWIETTIKVMIRELATITENTPQGRVAGQRGRMYTGTAVAMRDQIIYAGYYWEIEDVQFIHNLLGSLGYYDCTIIRLDAV